MNYVLLKDMPGIKSGNIFEKERCCYVLRNTRNQFMCRLNERFVEDNPEWFEEYKEEWEPNYWQIFHIFLSSGRTQALTWDDGDWVYEFLRFGNCFKTEEDAEEASRRVKKVLEDYHKELNY